MTPRDPLKNGYPEYWNERWETLGRAEAKDVEARKLRSAVHYAYSNSPFYHDRMKAEGVDPTSITGPDSLSRVGFTVKDELRSSQEGSPPFGDYLAVPLEKVNRVHRTSGTTGRPLFLALTRLDIEKMNECGARAYWSAGLRPGISVVHCMNYCLWTGGFSDHSNLERTGAAVVPFGVGQSRLLVRTIKALNIRAISATTSYLGVLEKTVREELGIEPRELGLKWGFLGGEIGLSIPSFRRRVEETWGMRAMDANYGLADVLSIFGSECRARDGMHFHGMGTVLCELVDSESGEKKEIVDGEEGEFVFTNLEKEAQPLVRFRSGDIAKIVSTDRCECGRTGFRFSIVGRTQDVLKVKGINVHISALQEIVSSLAPPLNGEFQIILEAAPPITRLRVLVEKGEAWSPKDDATEEMLRSLAKDRLGIGIEFELVGKSSLPRTEGKTSRIIRMY